MPNLGGDMMSDFGIGLHVTDAEVPSAAPDTAEEFAQQVIHAICHASVPPAVGRRTYERCMRALGFGSTSRLGFRHPGKAEAIDRIWRERSRLFDEYLGSTDKPAFLVTLPWVGPNTKHSLARRLGCHTEQEHRAVA
jgi:hypothetical protein